MTTRTEGLILEGADLEAARMVAVEALVLSVTDIESGGGEGRECERIGLVLERAWALSALGTSTDRWLLGLTERHCTVLAEGADDARPARGHARGLAVGRPA